MEPELSLAGSLQMHNGCEMFHLLYKCIMDSVRWWTYSATKYDALAMTEYTHHQKSALMDSDGDKNQVLAFIGGLDITDGRCVNGCYSLYRTLQTLHKDDFINHCFRCKSLGMICIL